MMESDVQIPIAKILFAHMIVSVAQLTGIVPALMKLYKMLIALIYETLNYKKKYS